MSSSPSSGKPPSLQELRAARAARPSFARRHRCWLIAGAVLGALLLFGFFGLPPIAKAQAVKELSRRLGREVKIETLRLNPLVLSATIEGFAIVEAQPAEGEFAGWRRLYVNFDSWSLFAGELRFQEIALEGFHARVVKEADGAMNFDDIVARLASQAAEPAKAANAEAQRSPLSIGRLAVSDARLEFSDASLGRPFTTVAGPVSFQLEKFHTVGDPDSPYQFEAATEAGERLAWKGTVSADPVKSQGELTLANIDLARLSPYYHRLVAGELRSAFLDVSGQYRFELRGAEPVLSLAEGEITLRDLRFGVTGSAEDAVKLRRLAVSGVSADTVSRRAEVAKVALEGVDLKVTREADGSIDLMRLLTPLVGSGAKSGAGAAAELAAAEADGADAGAGAGDEAQIPPGFTLGEFSVEGLRLEASDLSAPRRAVHRIEDLKLSLRGLDSGDLAKAMPLALDLSLPAGGRVRLDGTVAAQPVAAELDVLVEGLGLANASPYVEPFLNIRLVGGALRANGRATLREGVAEFAGDFGLGDFRAVDGKLAQDFVKWTDLAASGIRARSRPLSLHLDELRLVEPVGAIRVEADGSLSIEQAAAARPEVTAAAQPAEEDAAESAGPAAEITVGQVRIERAAFAFEDRSVRPTARGAVSEFGGTITGLSSAAPARAEVELAGKVDGSAPFSMKGRLNPLGTPAFVDLKVDFAGIDLQPGAGPYIGKFAGRELARGNLNLAIRASLDNRKLDTDTLVTLEQFYLGAQTDSPDATKLPVGLALALLRDTQGKIVIDLPVKGDLDDPSFKVGRVLLRVLTNILAKAATSPFSLLGAAFGGGGEELGWQEFPAGSAALDETSIRKLETVAKALNSRPALSLDLVGAHDPVRDGDALRRERLEQRLRALAWELRREVDPNAPPPEEIELTPELRVGMLGRLYAEAFPAGPDEAGASKDTGTVDEAEVPRTPPKDTAERKWSPFMDPRPEERARRQVGRLPKYGNVSSGPVTPLSVSFPPPAAPAEETSVAAPSESAAVGAEPVGAPPATPEEMAARLAARVELPEAELQALAEARARVIREWLLETGKVAGERIFLAPATEGGTRVNLNLK